MTKQIDTKKPFAGVVHGDPIGLIEHEIPHLRRYARYLTKNVEQADDMVQDCLVRAIENIDKWEPGTNLRAWLIVILRNNFFNVCRRQRKENEVKFDPGLASATIAPPAQDDALLLVDLTTAFGELSRDHREVIELIVIEGLSYDDVAALLSVNVGTVKSRLSRARAELRNRLDSGSKVVIPQNNSVSKKAKTVRRKKAVKVASISFGKRLQGLLEAGNAEPIARAA